MECYNGTEILFRIEILQENRFFFFVSGAEVKMNWNNFC